MTPAEDYILIEIERTIGRPKPSRYNPGDHRYWQAVLEAWTALPPHHQQVLVHAWRTKRQMGWFF